MHMQMMTYLFYMSGVLIAMCARATAPPRGGREGAAGLAQVCGPRADDARIARPPTPRPDSAHRSNWLPKMATGNAPAGKDAANWMFVSMLSSMYIAYKAMKATRYKLWETDLRIK